MTVRYRAVAQTGHWKSRDQIAPHFTLEFSRDSKRAKAEAIARFVKLMQQNRPCENGRVDTVRQVGAHAWLEISDRHGPRTIAKYVGIVDERIQPSGMASRGRWLLRAQYEDSGFQPEIKA